MSEAPLIHRNVLLLCVGLALGCAASPKPKPAADASRHASRSSIQTHPRDGMKELECKPDMEPSRDSDIRKSACETGDLHSCHALLRGDPKEVDATMAKRTLESACTGAGVGLARSPCACALYGSALTYDRKFRFDDRGLAVLSEACSDGALPACDEISLFGDLCSQRNEERPLCDKLRAAGLAHPPEPERPPPLVYPQLPEYLRDCFVVVRDLGGDKCDRDRVLASEGGGICDIDPSACPKASPSPSTPPPPRCATREIGAVYCFGPDRILLRKPKAADWTQQRTQWRAVQGEATFIGPDLSVRLDGREALIDGRYRLARADEQTRASATRFLTVNLDVCIHAKSCIDALDRLAGAVETDAPAPELPSDATGCAKVEADARKRWNGPLPSACR